MWQNMDFKPPANLEFSDNMADAWTRFKHEFEIYMEASDLCDETDRRKVNILLNVMGPNAQEVFRSFTFASDKERYEFETVIVKFDEYCLPRKNVTYERYKFLTRKQKNGEPFEEFVRNLKLLAKTCEFQKLENEMIVCTIIMGIESNHIRELLLRKSELTVDKVCNIVKTYLCSQEQALEMSAEPQAVEVNKITAKKIVNCKFCGRDHEIRKCPAYGQTCHVCKKTNHFATVCKSRNKTDSKLEEIGLSEINDVTYLSIDSLSDSQQDTEWHCTLLVEAVPIRFKMDSGSQVNVIPKAVFEKLKNGLRLKRCNVVLVTYGNNRIKPEGSVDLTVRKTGSSDSTILTFIVVDREVKPILGLRACENLKLLQRLDAINCGKDDVVEANIDVFSGIGCFPGEYEIKIEEDAEPVVCPPRRIPLSLQPRLKETLDKLERSEIIKKVDGPVKWLSNLVIVEKPDGSLRLCLDPKELNKVIRRELVQIPTIEDMIAKVGGNKIFSVIDMKDGFYHIKLGEKSKSLCSFGTPFGTYCFERLPFGIKSAPEVFSKSMYKIFGDIPGVFIYFDDMFLCSKNLDDHKMTLKKVFERARQCNVKFNPQKFKYAMNEVRYLGHVFTSDGLKLDENKIKAITEMPSPKNKEEVMRFLGMANYVCKFLPNFSVITAPLRELVKKDVLWAWGEPQQNAIKKVKQLITTAPILKFFDPKKKVTIQCDSSQKGLGAVLSQDECPIMYASRALTQTEQNWAQIEKELLAIVFSCERFHNFVYGREVTVQTDHKPLEVIINNKALHKVTFRLQRMLLRLLRYNIKVVFVPGKLMYISDTLSRAFLPETGNDDDLECSIHVVEKHLAISDERREQFQRECEKDPTLSELKNYYLNGWPNNLRKISSLCKAFYNIREGISLSEGLLFYDNKLIVPLSLRRDMLKLIHKSHQGIEKCKKLAREIMYWPGLSKQIVETVNKCETCNKFQKRNASEPLIPHELPKRAWETIGIDIFEHENCKYLVAKCYFSKWIECFQLKNGTSITEIIKILNIIFAQHGIPQKIVCDNSPFNSYQFKEYAKDMDFNIKFSSPTYSQSNGMAESAVKICQNFIKKCKDSGGNFHLCLLDYRNTPVGECGLSPAQLLLNRRLRTNIPIVEKSLSPEVQRNAYKKLQNMQMNQKRFYDKKTKILKPFSLGDSIYMWKDKYWKRGKVIKIHDAPRSYLVEVEGGIYRRNRKDLRKCWNNRPDDPKLIQVPESKPSTKTTEVMNRPKRNVRPPGRYDNFV